MKHSTFFFLFFLIWSLEMKYVFEVQFGTVLLFVFVMSPGVINAPFFALCTHLAQASLELATSWSSYQLCRLKTDSMKSTLK